MYTKIKEIYSRPQTFIGKAVKLGGWIKTSRDGKNFGFIELSDGSFFKSLQIVLDHALENYHQVMKLTVGSAITVSGEIVESQGQKQAIEAKASAIEIEGASDSDYPLQKKRHSFEYLREIAHLRPRANTFQAVFRIRSLASYAIHKFFSDRGFVYVHTPIITGSDAEGAGEMFKVTTLDLEALKKNASGKVDYREDFFGKAANLTVSGQLSAETFALAFRDVYTFGPTFRAENSNTTRHAAEFWMIEPEMAFADLDNDKELAESMLKFIVKYCLENAPDEIEFLGKHVDSGLQERLNSVLSSAFASVTYTEAASILSSSGMKFDYPVKWGMDLQTEHERFLTEQAFKKPIFVTDYPKQIKAFYMRANDDGKTVAAMDLLAPGIGEIIGGSQREERLEVLKLRMAELSLKEEDYWWYLDLRKYGSAKHAGFGMGFERLIMYLTGMQNIRDVIAYPRTAKNAEF
ncbi:MAG: asparagine--tRNA ligase [Clostridiales bacterium]|jgi:asparaginyl-tRNA synthetase|nr:asparagine--tRNA ligase [Clostridiales bacterium]